MTRKTYTPNYRTHKSVKNRGQRPQSRYKNHHTAIVSRDDFIAVQRLLDNARYKNKAFLPELRVVDSGILKGFVVVNPRWAGFKERDYLQAAFSVYNSKEEIMEPDEYSVEVSEGDFDLRGFEIVRSEMFDGKLQPWANFRDNSIKFGCSVVRKFGDKNYVELLINPLKRKFAIRTTDRSNRNGVVISKKEKGMWVPREFAITAFGDTLFSLFDWKTDYRYRALGHSFENGDELVYIFDVADAEAFVRPYLIPNGETNVEEQKVETARNKSVLAIPELWLSTFGKQFYVHEQTLVALENQNEEDWKLRLEGRLFETANKLNVTSFEVLQEFIKKELKGLNLQEVTNE